MELSKEYPYLTEKEVEYYRTSSKLKSERGIVNRIQKINEEHRIKAEMPDVKYLKIEIGWKRTRVGEMNPTASAKWETADGEWHYADSMARATGYGCDKASTVVAKCCNKILTGMLWRKRDARGEAPYGINYGDFFPYFSGGIQMECYERIAEFLEGNLEHTASGKTYDEYVFTFKTEKV